MSIQDEEKLEPAVMVRGGGCPGEDARDLDAGWKRVLLNLKWAAERPPARIR